MFTVAPRHPNCVATTPARDPRCLAARRRPTRRRGTLLPGSSMTDKNSISMLVLPSSAMMAASAGGAADGQLRPSASRRPRLAPTACGCDRWPPRRPWADNRPAEVEVARGSERVDFVRFLRRAPSRLKRFDLFGEAGFGVDALGLQSRGHECRLDGPGFGHPGDSDDTWLDPLALGFGPAFADQATPERSSDSASTRPALVCGGGRRRRRTLAEHLVRQLFLVGREIRIEHRKRR